MINTVSGVKTVPYDLTFDPNDIGPDLGVE
jgi:hypothetical protein